MWRKSDLCKHKNSCVENTLKGISRGLLIGSGIKLGINLLKALAKLKLLKNPSVIFKFGKSDLMFVLFLSGMIGAQNSVLCALRRLTNNEKISSFFSGFAGGIPLILESSENRTLYSIFTFVRAAETLIKYLVSIKALPKIPYALEITFIISFGYIMWVKVYDVDCLNKGMYGMVKKMFHAPTEYMQIDMTGFEDEMLRKKNV